MTDSSGTPEAPRPRSPRARRRRSLLIQGVIGLIVILVIGYLVDWGRLAEAYLNLPVAADMWPEVLRALGNTLLFTLGAFVFGIVGGVVLAMMHLSSVAPYRWIARIYVEIFRGLPALLVLFIVGYGIPRAFPGFRFPGDVYGQVTAGLGVVAAAYMAETIRAGIQAVPRGQLEAARSLGMSHGRTMRRIVLPQAIRIVIPPLTNEFVLLTKDSALAYILGVTAMTMEITKLGEQTMNAEASPTPLLVAGLLYLVITIPLSHLARRLEARLSPTK
ncbi:MAG TPA: amino acid ABC transporter permease [Stackebrandtia sp.]|jgi:polar amino acid transport system permease protein|uniref:amino acid ABC transporter permease n=1 Tax=Stackebrandtia sp. TaxID=2023065 RepID=UPI002D3C14A4|nr:amino acid ABC transporter permease [Stackebrandtia sp.]HZE38578.1 amino acid ABC transporter permease [Stackebrandtia sp.]